MNLHPMHLDDLRRSGLTDATIEEAGLFSEDDPLKLTNWLNGRKYPKRCGSALVFPFREVSGELNGYRRLKPSSPRKDRNGRTIKYESPSGVGNRAYLPAGVIPLMNDPAAELVLTEGEKKSLAATQAGFGCIGLTGVFGWKAGRKADSLIPDLQAIAWQGRRVFIAFDSDLADKPEVQDAESRLAAQLRARGAVVKVVRLPDGPEGAKQGLDDYLVAHGPIELRKLLDAAGEPEALQAAAKVPANQLDPMREARVFLEVTRKRGHDLKRLGGNLYGFNGKSHEFVSDDYLRSILMQSLDSVATQLSRGVVGNIESCLHSLIELPAATAFNSWLGGGRKDRNLVAVENGLLDIDALLADRADVLLPHSPKWFSLVCLPFKFDVEAECPQWERVVAEILECDAERIAVLQEFFGWCLIRDMGFQKFMMLVGEGANGKSVALAVLRGMLGPGNVAHVPLELFGDKFRLISTLGKLANIAAEVGELDKICEGYLKSFTSGDCMQFEQKFKPTVDAVPTARLILATNNPPRLSDRSGGLWRRLILVPFRVTIPPERQIVGMDKPEYWTDEYPGILNWAIVGLIRLMEQKRFTESSVVADAVAEYRSESNPARTFLSENYTRSPGQRTGVEDTYKAYREFCTNNGYHPLAAGTFGKEIKRVFPGVTKTRAWAGGNREHVYNGIIETRWAQSQQP